MANKIDRIVIDTNLWISFLLNKDFSRLDTILKEHKAVLLFSNELLEEFVEVCRRPKLRKYISQDEVEQILTTVYLYAEFVVIASVVSVCRDPRDNFLLALTKDGRAKYLITGDTDLLVLKKYSRTKIITIAEYLKPTGTNR